MDQAVRKPMSVDEFLAWECGQELRYEFDGFEPIPMTGGTVRHNMIGFNLTRALQDRLGAGPCRAFHADLKIMSAGNVRYPDVVVTCSPVPGTSDIVPEPVAVVEMLSASTSRVDRTIKNAEYRDTPSIRHYAMLEQNAAAATIFTRAGDLWVSDLAIGLDATLKLPAPGIEIPLAAIYAGIELTEDAPDD